MKIIKPGYVSSFIALLICFGNAVTDAQSKIKHQKLLQTFCNPINIPYNFQSPGVTRREAADPTILWYQGKYWLFASKQDGYYFSGDMVNWTYVKSQGLPIDLYAPSVSVINGKLYYMAPGNKGTYTTNNPATGEWVNVNPYAPGCNDPDVFEDTDGRVYLYDGCSDKTPIRITELDSKTFLPAGPRINVIYADPAHHGWEVAGDNNDGREEGDLSASSIAPWIEGSYMNKINGKYYLQYSAPGTQFKSYGDGVYVSDKPTGPFIYQSYSPFSFKPTGFIAGAGHSCTFTDKNGRYWHIATGTISVRHSFERRLVLFPAGVLHDGQLVVNTYLGDYPQFAPDAIKSFLNNSPKWMLLSYDKPATASSVLVPAHGRDFNIKNAFDEDIRTWWSAATANPGEWLQVDLGKKCRINAVQTNFADQDAEATGHLVNDGYGYIIRVSNDGKNWKVIIDRSKDERDAPHDYVQLVKPVLARYVRITNVHSPAGALFSIYGLRIFGSALGTVPPQVKHFSVKRNLTDQRQAHIQWDAVPNADFYIVRYGIAPDRMFGNYQVYKATNLNINSLNVGTAYYFTVDAVNSTGITKGIITSIKN